MGGKLFAFMPFGAVAVYELKLKLLIGLAKSLDFTSLKASIEPIWTFAGYL